ncbi:ClpXP protease specificity-enhancing factor [Dokdonella sp.]|jgi:stringent starvation protein B|uniref:ClpXP protease specificity-enhancing factor n=1 Tax=Dokdonella sp. TaxID=2291710 RepID=UPI002CAB0CA4|nr:ClpXP protease specificity-enhancing factor [Dokdonella sp.]HNV08111.1 ClpXP protease specificity-enhancing factor [Dokdonella sp.]
MATDQVMSSNRPYLLRAMHEWINDNGMTPYMLVDANAPGVHVPPASVKDGRVVLSIASRAVVQFEIGNEIVRFLARFGGVSHTIQVPVSAVMAIYAQENGQGMMFQAEESSPPPNNTTTEETATRPKLRVVK